VPQGANQFSACCNEENPKRQLKRFDDCKTANKNIKDAVISAVATAGLKVGLHCGGGHDPNPFDFRTTSRGDF